MVGLMSHKTYLGHKGYSIYKNTLSVKEAVYIREELMVKPYLPKSPVQPEPFPIYRESNNKFYVPRIFGINNFGIPNDMRISQGDPINIKFNGKLLDTPERNQVNVVNKFMDHIKDGNSGGLDELVIPEPEEQIDLENVSGVNPSF